MTETTVYKIKKNMQLPKRKRDVDGKAERITYMRRQQEERGKGSVRSFRRY